MDLIREVIPASEMQWSGGVWRAYIRGVKGHPPRPDKVRRVMSCVKSDLKEGKRIDTTIAAYALDLYKRFADHEN